MTGTRSTGGRGAAEALHPDLVVLGRYRLVDRVADTGGTSLWRGVDDRLRRPVAVRFMGLDADISDELRRSAASASHVTDRRAVAVLDIDQDLVTERLVVVTEWLNGNALGDLLVTHPDPMPAREASHVTLEVARFLAAAAAEGVHHGRVRPNCVIVTDTGEVRIRGLGVDSVLYGVEPGTDPAAADIHGAGAVLYACLTGRWPGEPVDGLPAAPAVERGRVPWPSRVVADVPRSLDQVVARSLLTTTPPKGRGRYESIDEMVADLQAVLNPATVPVATGAQRGHEPWRPWLRVFSVLFFTAAAVALGWLGLNLITGLGSPPVSAPRTTTPTPTISATPTVSGSAAAPGTRVLPVVSVDDFDPFGDTLEENPELARFAIDGKPATAWKTVRYRNGDLSGKPGVGLMLDLGAPRPVSAVDLRLLGNGTDVSLRATDDTSKDPEEMRSLAEVTGVGNAVTLRLPRPVTTRYVLVWLTEIPAEGGGFQGGIAEVVVLG